MTDVFELFSKRWALVTAGKPDDHNGCTVAWGSIGSLWGKKVVTVYIHPARYTLQYMQQHDSFTVSFFPDEYRKALGYMGSHSGREGDKTAAAGLTAAAIGDSTTFAEAELTLLCRKLYQYPFEKEALDKEIQDLYSLNPKSYPVDETGQWQPHWVFVGEIIDERRGE